MKTLKELILAGILVLVSGGLAGCETYHRESIVSCVDTGLGLALTENPSTELYEARLGYIRSQFYSIPTGKLVRRHFETNVQQQFVITTNRADIVPDLVSGVRVESSYKQLFLGANISETFAVGTNGVNSRAATAMFIANAASEQQAASAAKAALRTSERPELKEEDIKQQEEIESAYDASDSDRKSRIKAIIKEKSGLHWRQFKASADAAEIKEAHDALVANGILKDSPPGGAHSPQK